MNNTLLLLLLLPILLGGCLRYIFNKDISYIEMGCGFIITSLLVFGLFQIGKYQELADVEILNGSVTKKYHEKVSCEHSYRCRCYTSCTGYGSKMQCRQKCSTCYKHPYDFSWFVETNVGNVRIKRENIQGLEEPKRFSEINIGDPASAAHSFDNYVKAAKHPLFQTNPIASKKYANYIPSYPNVIADYYHATHVVGANWKPNDWQEWDKGLAKALTILGPQKNINIIIVFTKGFDKSYATALQSTWFGGKKNDAIIVINTIDEKTTTWVKVFSWSKNKLFNTTLEKELELIQPLNSTEYILAISNNTQLYFEKTPNEEYKYLLSKVVPTQFMIWLTVFLSITSSILMNIFIFRKNN